MTLEGKSVYQEQTLYSVWSAFVLALVKCSHLVSVISSINFQIDIDECKGSNNVCDENANCSNTVGSYNCTCKDGFTGDGHSCSGKIVTDMPRYNV